jgi:hypothetical protein
MENSVIRLAALAAALCMPAGRAAAQQSVSEALTFLVTNQSVATGSIERDAAAAQATSTTISNALLANLATLPVTSTSGAFVYRLNPSLGTVERITETLGPVFLDRALTSGTGAGSIGLSFQHLHFTALDGNNLRDGSLVTTANQFVDEAEPFDIDRLTLNLDADVATLYGNVGIGNRIDLSGAAPLIWLRMDGTRVNTYRGTNYTQAAATARAVGLADILLRGKVNVFAEEGTAIGAAVDVRLPTGRKEDLLGTGKTSVRFSALGSLEGARASGHANVGVAFGGLADEIDYGLAIASAMSPHMTVSVDALGRWVNTPGDITTVSQMHPTLADVETLRLLPGTTDLKTFAVAPGFKWNVGGTWVLVANVGIPLLKGGLRAPVLPFAALEYSFGR